jgi:hypothetical protein
MALPPHLADLEGRLASRVEEALTGFRRAFEARLRGATERLLAEATDVPPPAVDGLFAEVERAALDEAPRRAGAEAAVASLVEAARAFDRAKSQGEVLEALIGAGRSTAERLALFLVRDERLVAFESAGCNGALERGRELAFEGPLRARIDAAGGCLALAAEDAADLALRLDLAAGGEAVVVPLVLRDRIAALLWADRRGGSPDLASLRILATLAAQRLELQALTERAYTPTLYDGAATPGAPLPLWSAEPTEAPAPAAEAVGEEPALEEAPAFEVVAAATEAPAAAEAPATWSALEAPGEAGREPIVAVAEAWTGSTVEIESAGEEVAELFEAAPEATEPSAREEAPAFSWEEEEAAAEAAVAAEPAPAEASAPFAFEEEAEPVEAAPAAPEPEPPGAVLESEAEPEDEPAAPAWIEPAGDVLRTVRLPILNFPLAGAQRTPEETTAPVRVAEVSPAAAGEGASTHEFPAPEPAAPSAPIAASAEVSDVEATVLSRRSPFASAGAPVESVPPRMTVPVAPVAPTPPPPPPVEDPMERTASRMRSTEVAPPPDLQGPGRAFLSGRAQRLAADQPTHEEAKRLARLLISEIKLYNEEQVLEGRRNRDLYHRLKEDIDRSRQIYEERVDPAVRQGSDYFQQELVRSLAGGDARALGI